MNDGLSTIKHLFSTNTKSLNSILIIRLFDLLCRLVNYMFLHVDILDTLFSHPMFSAERISVVNCTQAFCAHEQVLQRFLIKMQ